jgi:hypothetical protein
MLAGRSVHFLLHMSITMGIVKSNVRFLISHAEFKLFKVENESRLLNSFQQYEEALFYILLNFMFKLFTFIFIRSISYEMS